MGVGKICDFWLISRCISVMCEMGPRLLLLLYTGSQLVPNSMTLNDLERQNRGFYGFFGNFGLRHKSILFTMWRHATIVMRSRWRIWYLYINLAWTPQFSAKLLNRNCYRLSRVSWALAQIFCFSLCARLKWQLSVRVFKCNSCHVVITGIYTVSQKNIPNIFDCNVK